MQEDSPTVAIVEWLKNQDRETQQFVMIQLKVMGVEQWLDVECSPDAIEESLTSLRGRPARGPTDVGLALWLRALVSFAVAKMGDKDWSTGDKLHSAWLGDPDPSKQEIARRFFEQKPLRAKRWERVANDWREYVATNLTDELLDEWLVANFAK